MIFKFELYRELSFKNTQAKKLKILTLSLMVSYPASISLLEACLGPLKRATLAEKR
jgi:hypothetical protein